MFVDLTPGEKQLLEQIRQKKERLLKEIQVGESNFNRIVYMQIGPSSINVWKYKKDQLPVDHS